MCQESKNFINLQPQKSFQSLRRLDAKLWPYQKKLEIEMSVTIFKEE